MIYSCWGMNINPFSLGLIYFAWNGMDDHTPINHVLTMTQMATDIYKYNFKGMDIHNSQLV